MDADESGAALVFSMSRSARTQADDCGFRGISQSQCTDRGCCWVEEYYDGRPWCYFASQCSSNCGGGSGACASDGTCTSCRSGYSGPRCTSSPALNAACLKVEGVVLSAILDDIAKPDESCLEVGTDCFEECMDSYAEILPANPELALLFESALGLCGSVCSVSPTVGENVVG